MKFVTINIGAASRQRAGEILPWLSSQQADVLVLSETSMGDGTAFLLDRIAAAGWKVVHNLAVDRGVAVASRITCLPLPPREISMPGRLAEMDIHTNRGLLRVCGTYIPSRDSTEEKVQRKKLFIREFQEIVLEYGPEVILSGDYNLITRDHEPRLPGFFEFEYEFMDSVERLGFADAARALNGGVRDHTWFGRTGDRYCYDYFHVRPGDAILDDNSSCKHLHETRALGLTDHSAIELIIPDLSGAIIGDVSFSESDQIAMF